jgi:hypothetical protein
VNFERNRFSGTLAPLPESLSRIVFPVNELSGMILFFFSLPLIFFVIFLHLFERIGFSVYVFHVWKILNPTKNFLTTK